MKNFNTKNFDYNFIETYSKVEDLENIIYQIKKIQVDQSISSTVVRNKIYDIFEKKNFIIKPVIGKGSKLTISAVSRKKEIGVCIQLGNASRLYADLIKLQYMFNEQYIKRAIFICFTREHAKEFKYQNIVSFERAIDEVNTFKSIINMPIHFIGLDTLF